MNAIDVKVLRLPNFVAMPEYKSLGAAAMDLYAAEDVTLPSAEALYRDDARTIKVPTGIAIQLPPGYEAQIRARSGMAAKGVMVVNGPGTIDSDYTGEICVLLHNLSCKPFKIGYP